MSKKIFTPLRIVAIVVIAIGLLVGISFMPLEQWSGGRLSNFNLFSDILNLPLPEEKEMPGAYIDPCLNEEIPVKADTREIDTAAVAEGEKPLIAIQANKVDGKVVIEDYTESGEGLENLRKALQSPRLARIAVVGDSYIEGDIFTQDLRNLLQEKYGGTGVGYVNMHSEFPGFRRSVRQGGGNGWKEYAANKKVDDSKLSITQHYYTLTSPSKSTYAGSGFPGTKSWTKSQFLFISPTDTKITLTTDSGEYAVDVVGSPDLQCLTISEKTSKFDVKTSRLGLTALGVWLTDTVGVNVDCMSSRGFSGVTLLKADPSLAAQMSSYVPYDLVVLEFGINAMSATQKDFSNYQKKMEQVIEHLRSIYPDADILMLGIGDRGSKRGAEVHSMTSAPFMVDAQREAARRGRCLFWDTREAMGGEDAIVEWVRQHWANTDYVHLNHKGGAQLAQPLFEAIEMNLAQ